MSSVVGALAGGAAKGLLGGLLGGGDDKAARALQPRILGFNAGGMRLSRKGDVLTLSRDAGRKKTLLSLQRATMAGATRLQQLGKQFRPGFGRLSAAAQAIIGDRRRAAVSDLRDMFARRRISGSSFASDAISRTEAEFARQQQMANAEAFAQELALTQENLKAETGLRVQAYAGQLSQMNFDAKLGADLAVAGQQTLAGLAANQAGIYQGMADRQEGMWAGTLNDFGQSVVDIVNRYMPKTGNTTTSSGGFQNPAALGIATVP